jgi:hypothetical protein
MTASHAERHPWHLRFAAPVAHATPAIWLSLIVIYFVSDIGLSTLASTATFFLGAAIVFYTVYAETHHQSNLCVYCAKATPLKGPSSRAVKALLWSAHNVKKVTYVFLAAWVPLSVLRLTVELPSLVDHALGATIYLLFAWQAQSFLSHRVHRPWCPHCKGWGDGGGDDGPKEVVPDPMPSERAKV